MSSTTLNLDIGTFTTSGGSRIFQLPLLVFPGLWGYAYLALAEGEGGSYRVLIDAGSGFGDSNQHLEAGLASVSNRLGFPLGLPDLTHVLITHGHIDHFGGLSYVRPRTPARIGVHELDLRNLTNHEERLTLVARLLRTFLLEAGVAAERVDPLLDLYRMTKSLYQSVHVDFTFEAIGMHLGPFEILHVPGHCAGHVAIRLDDVLFSGDHVLADVSPHQSPEKLTHSTGLDHYLKSLEALRWWFPSVRLTLGGHNEPILDLGARIDEIQRLHAERLEKTLWLMEEPHTIAEVSHALFGEVHGYNVLLALEEAGAHVEYLYQRGLLGVENLEEVERAFQSLPIRYRCLPCISETTGHGAAVARIFDPRQRQQSEASGLG
jgi:glyoxylase-like metal-dependent hydrolase (beta-lactamase superfamily II)